MVASSETKNFGSYKPLLTYLLYWRSPVKIRLVWEIRPEAKVGKQVETDDVCNTEANLGEMIMDVLLHIISFLVVV